MPIPYAIHHFIRGRCQIILFSIASMGLTIAPSPGLDIDIVSEVARTMRKDLIDSGANPDFTLAEYLIPGIDSEFRMKLFASKWKGSGNPGIVEAHEDGTVKNFLLGKPFSTIVSGTMHSKIFYYSCVWGSGFETSAIGVIKKSSSGLIRAENALYVGQERNQALFIGIKNGTPMLLVGTYVGFNLCEDPRVVGKITISEQNTLRVVDKYGLFIGINSDGIDVKQEAKDTARPAP